MFAGGVVLMQEGKSTMTCVHENVIMKFIILCINFKIKKKEILVCQKKT